MRLNYLTLFHRTHEEHIQQCEGPFLDKFVNPRWHKRSAFTNERAISRRLEINLLPQKIHT